MNARIPLDSINGANNSASSFHLQNGCDSPAEQLSDRQGANHLAFTVSDHTAHREIESVCGGIAHIFSPTSEHGIANMIMRADKARQYHLAGRIDHRRGIMIPGVKFVAGTQVSDFVVHNDNRAVSQYAPIWIDRDHGCMINE